MIGVGLGIAAPEMPIDYSSKIPVTVTICGIALSSWHRRSVLNAANGRVVEFVRGSTGHAPEGDIKDDFANGIATIATPVLGTMSGYMTHAAIEHAQDAGSVDPFTGTVAGIFVGLTVLGAYMTSPIERDSMASFRDQLNAIDGRR